MLLSLLNFFLNLVAPYRCLSCSIEVLSYGLCGKCWGDLSHISDNICSKCGNLVYREDDPQDSFVLCDICQNHTQYYELARSVYENQGVAREMVMQIKYSKDLSALQFIVKQILRFYLQAFKKCDLIIPVPIHINKLQKKYYNHTAIICNGLYKALKKSNHEISYLCDFLVKYKDTISQTQLNQHERLHKEHYIKINDKYLEWLSRQNNIKILIIDDVITTGSTVNYISKIIKKANRTAEVYCLSFVRTALES